jgi:acetyl-CoA synthetase
MTEGIDVAAAKSELYSPDPAIIEQANVPDYLNLRSQAAADPVSFWDARAKELLDWYTPYTQVLDSSGAPFYKWFVGGKTNVVHNALDRHVQSWRKNKVAFIWEAEDGEVRQYTYHDLWREVNRFANVLKGQGIRKGDTVTIYMGRVPELPIAMLATAKIGAIHSVVYGGFSEQALADRINDAQSRVVVTCDGAWLRGKTVNLKDITDEAVARTPIVESVIVPRPKAPPNRWMPKIPSLFCTRAAAPANPRGNYTPAAGTKFISPPRSSMSLTSRKMIVIGAPRIQVGSPATATLSMPH